MRVLALLLSLALAGLVLGGCNKQDAYTHADTEGLYLAAGGLTYQVQLSRELNPALTEDRSLLKGVPPSEQKLAPDQLWFGVWLRVENDGKRPHTSSDNFGIVDAQGNAYDPVSFEPDANILAYKPERLAAGDLYPDLDSVAASCCPRQGALLLFKINRSVYQNRPADFEIRSTNVPVRTQATVELDL